MSEKNIYEALNDVDGSIDDFDKVELTDIEKAKYKKAFKPARKKFNLKRVGVVAAAVALGLFLFGQTGFGSYVYARVESALGGLTYPMAKALYLKEDVEPYVNVVNEVVEDKGVAVKLTDCAIDRDELLLTFLVEVVGEKLQHADFDYAVYINGKRANWGGHSGSSGRVDGEDGLCFVNYSIDVKGIDSYEDLDVKIDVSHIELSVAKEYDGKLEGSEEPYTFDYDGITYVEDEKEVRGSWVFNFNASGKDLALNTRSISLSNIIDCGVFSVQLEELRMNPVNKKLYAKVLDVKPEYSYYNFAFIGHDDLGNEVEFGMRRYDGESGKTVLSIENLHSNLSDDASSITLDTFVSELPKGGGRIGEPVKVGESFTINLDE